MDKNKLVEKVYSENDVQQQNASNIMQYQSVRQQNYNTQGPSMALALDGLAIADQFNEDTSATQIAKTNQNNPASSPIILEYCCYPGDYLMALKKPLNLKMDKNTGSITLNGSKINPQYLGREIISYILS